MGDSYIQKHGMNNTNKQAEKVSQEKKHRFFSDDPTRRQSPKLSKAGQYFIPCLKCQRLLFEDGTGSAVSVSCYSVV